MTLIFSFPSSMNFGENLRLFYTKTVELFFLLFVTEIVLLKSTIT